MKSFILGDDGKRYDVLTLGPIAVLPVFHCTTAKNAGHRAVLLCGDPRYYEKLGFTAAERFNIRSSENKYLAALHAYPLYTDALKNAAGRYFEDEIYNVDETEVMTFDAHFPPKERLTGTSSQQRFQEVLSMQKDYSPQI